jgi:hypothetical protein
MGAKEGAKMKKLELAKVLLWYAAKVFIYTMATLFLADDLGFFEEGRHV